MPQNPIDNETDIRRIIADEMTIAMRDICTVCPEHAAHAARIKEVEVKQSSLRSDTGAINRIETKIGEKVGKTSFQAIMALALAFIGVLFGLIYGSNRQLISEMVVFQVAIKEKMYANQAQMDGLAARVSALTNQVQMLVDDRHRENAMGGSK